MNQKINWLFGSRKRGSVWFLILFGMVSLMLAPVSRMNSNGSNPDLAAALRSISEPVPSLNPSLLHQHRGGFVPDAGVTLECASKAAQPLADTAADHSEIGLLNTTSSDGRYVVFTSLAVNLVTGQTEDNPGTDIFLYDRVAGTTRLVSRAAGTIATTGDQDSRNPMMSADGRWIIFESDATNLVPGLVKANFETDVFVYDRVTDTNQLVSRAAGTTTTTGDSGIFQSVISADGQWIAFTSFATNYVAGQTDTNGFTDVFVFNRVTGTTELVSRVAGTITTASNGFSFNPVISGDGQFIAYSSNAPDLVLGQPDLNETADVFVYGRVSGTTQLVSRAAGSPMTAGNDYSVRPAISADGQFITYYTAATNLVPGVTDTNGTTDVCVFNRVTGTTELASGDSTSATNTGNSESFDPLISADGNFIVFRSFATNLVTGQIDTNAKDDVFVYNRVSGTTQLVSRVPGTTTAGNADSFFPVISADGKFIVFSSNASNLVTGQANTDGPNVFVFHRLTGITRLVSRVAGTTTTCGNSSSDIATISADGLWVAFQSRATNLVQDITDAQNTDIFLFNQSQNTTTVATLHAPGATSLTGVGESILTQSIYKQSMSSDGRYVVFSSAGTRLVPGQLDTNEAHEVFVYDRITGTTELISRAPGTTATTANGGSFNPIISLDGQWIAFESVAGNLVPGQVESNGDRDVFLYNRVAKTIQLVSRVTGTTTTTGNRSSLNPVLSADGRYVAFASQATNLVAGQTDTNGIEGTDVFVYDRVAGTTQLVSRVAGTTATAGNLRSFIPTMSSDGQWIVFHSLATNLVPGLLDTNESSDVFVYDRVAGTTQLVSRLAGTITTTANNNSIDPVISADGQLIAFESEATNLVIGQTDTNSVSDTFVFHRISGTMELVSRAAGTTTTTGNFASTNPVINGNGRYITYSSYGFNLVVGQSDTNGDSDIFVFDRIAGTNQLVSRATGTTTVTGDTLSLNPAMSTDGQRIVYESAADNLIPGQVDGLGVFNIFAFDLMSGETQLMSGESGSPTMTGNNESNSPQISNDGQVVGFSSRASNLIPSDYNNTEDIFLTRLSQPGNSTATLTGGGTGCAGQPTTLTATIVGGIPPYTLTLTNGGGTQTGTSPLTFTVSPSSTTTYAIQSGTDASGNPITGSGSATVTVTSCLEQSSVLVADTTNNRIQKFNGTTWSVVGPGTVGSGNGQFRVPEAVAFNSSGRIYVADTGNNRIQWSTNGGTTWATFAASGVGLNQVSGPRGLALDSIGNLYVADGGNGRIARFNNGVPGNAVILATKGTTAGRVQTPNGLAIDIAFNLFIADTGNNRIQKITSAHTKTTPNTGTQIAGLGSGLTAVRAPQGVAVDSSGNLYVADTGNNRITRFAGGNPGTATLLAGAGAALGQVRAPEGVTLSAFSTGPLVGGVSLVVSDTTNNRIQGRNLNGTTWVLVGSPNGLGTNPGQFRAPSKLR